MRSFSSTLGGSGGASTQRVLLFLLAISILVNMYQFSSTINDPTHSHCKDCSRCPKVLVSRDKPCPPCPLSSKSNKNKNNGNAAALDHDDNHHEQANNDNDNDEPKTKDDGADNKNNNENANSPADENARDSSSVGVKYSYNGEIGYYYGTERVARKTVNTIYNPDEDKALFAQTQALGGRYARSAIPLPSWKIRVSPSKWVTMDEICFAYDAWFNENQVFQYMSWLGVFVQQDPSDAFVIQQMLWQVKPDLVIEIGTNTGGGAVFYSSIMGFYNKNHKVVTLDVKEVSNWNARNNDRCEKCIMGDKHPLWTAGNIHFIKGRVTEEATRKKVDEFVKEAKTVLVIEDASHRYPDTLQNIEAVHHWVTPGSYMLVQDTKMDRFVAGLKMKYGRHKFGPMRSVDEFLKKHDNFVVDRKFEYLMYSQHHRGFLKKLKD